MPFVPVEHSNPPGAAMWRRWTQGGRRRTGEGRERDAASRGRDRLCYNAGKARPSYELLLCSEEYGEQAGQQPNEQHGGCVEEPRCPGSAPARVHLWYVSSRLAGIPFHDRRRMEEPYIRAYALQAFAVHAWTARFQGPACRHPVTAGRRG